MAQQVGPSRDQEWDEEELGPEDDVDDYEVLAIVDLSQTKRGTSNLPEDILQMHSAAFLGSMKEQSNLTQRAIDDLVKGVDKLTLLYNNFLEAQILKLGGEDDTVKKKDIVGFFDQMKHQSIFEGVKNQYRLNIYESKHYEGLLKPVLVVLQWKKIILHHKIREVPDEFGYVVGFKKQLENFLQQEEVLYCVDNPRENVNSQFSCALDGNYYKTHPVTMKYPNALGIVLYVDDIDTTEILSSYQEQALRNFSWTLANIYPELRSTLRSINPLALVKAKVAKKYRNEPFLRDFIEVMNKLSSEEGLKLTINAVERTFHGFLFFIIGDYPASGNLAGFKESASKALRPCRQCLIYQHELRSKFQESEVIMRTASMHSRHIHEMKARNIIPDDDDAQMEGENVEDFEDDDEEDEAHDEVEEGGDHFTANLSAKYGINYQSCLLKLNHFDISKCLPQDIMHLFLEGILELECRLLLQHSIEMKLIKLGDVNSFLLYHDYGHLKTDKPSPISAEHVKSGLHQSSSQMLMLSSLLPFILKGKCDEARLFNFILLQMILGICMSRLIMEEDVCILNTLILQYLKQFTAFYPKKMVPKHHFLIHLPSQIRLFGPLTEQWAMRWEAFHARMKRLAKIIHSAKNLAFSILSRLLRKRALEFRRYGSKFLTSDTFEARVVSSAPVSLIPFSECVMSVVADLKRTNFVSVIDKLSWYGSEIIPGKTIIHTGEDRGELPVFGCVCHIYGTKNTFIIVHRELLVTSFCKEVNAYEVKFTSLGCFSAFDAHKEHCDLTPQMHIKFLNSDYIVLRHKRNPSYKSILPDV